MTNKNRKKCNRKEYTSAQNINQWDAEKMCHILHCNMWQAPAAPDRLTEVHQCLITKLVVYRHLTKVQL